LNHCIKEGDIERLKEAVRNLEGWQQTQNGALIRLSEELADVNDCLEAKIDELNSWIRKTLFTTVLTLIGLIANIILMEVFK